MRIEVARLVIAILLISLVSPAIARGPWRASEANTRGWQLMTPEERIGHQTAIRGFKTLEQCRAYQAEHHQLMEERARQRDMALPGGGRDICGHLKSGQSAR